MCWNARVSLNTYVVALFGTLFALANGMSLNLVAWIHLFSMMQLVEHFIWRNIANAKWNTIFSTLGLLILVLEPVASMFLMNPSPLRKKLLSLYAVFVLVTFVMFYPWKPYTRIANNGHLAWEWQGTIPIWYNVIWVIFFIVPIFLAGYKILGFVAVTTVLITYYTYHRDGSWGSMWCWIANGIWLYIIGAIALQKCHNIKKCF